MGPQNWFKEAHGQPAEALAREDVGPHLPPGGECLAPISVPLATALVHISAIVLELYSYT